MSAYDVFRPEFDRMSEQQKLEIGLAGIAAMHERGGFVATANPRAARSSRQPDTGLAGRGKEELVIDSINNNTKTEITSFDDKASMSLVDRMVRETYRVRVTNILTDLLEPLGYKLEDLMLRNQMFETRMHNEHFLYYRSLIGEVRNLGTTNRENFFEGLILQYRNFMRHPVWNSLRILADKVLRPLANMVTGVLFGFKKQMSDTDRIVQAIEKQTEFQRTGRIEADGNMFTRLFRTGIVNSTIRRAIDLSSGGRVGIDAAQGAREKKARGEEVGIYDKLAMRWFGKYADFFDTKQKDDDSISSLVDINIRTHNMLIDKLDQLIAVDTVEAQDTDDIFKILSMMQNSSNSFTPKNIHDVLIQAMAMGDLFNGTWAKAMAAAMQREYAQAGGLGNRRSSDNTGTSSEYDELQKDHDRRHTDLIAKIVKGQETEDKKDDTQLDLLNQTYEVEEEKIGLFSKMVEWLKDTTGYLKKHDRRETRRSFTGLLGGVASFIGNILPGLGLAGLFGGGALLAWKSLPEDIRKGLKDGFLDLGKTATDAVVGSMNWTSWAGVIGAGILATKLGGPLGMTVGGALIGMAWFAHKANKEDPAIKEFYRIREEEANRDPLPEGVAWARMTSSQLALADHPDVIKEKAKLNELIQRRDEIVNNVDNIVATTSETYKSLDETVSDLNRSIDEMKVGINNLSNLVGRDGLLSRRAVESALLINRGESSTGQGLSGIGGKQGEFYRKNKAEIDAVARQLGVSPAVITSQLALETGWGDSVIPGTRNLGNIKAGSSWEGDTVRAHDSAEGSNDRYRVYESAEAFATDYVNILRRNYPGVLGTGNDINAFSTALRNGRYGSYATDPNYESSLARTHASLMSKAGEQSFTPTVEKPKDASIIPGKSGTTSSQAKSSSDSDIIQTLIQGFSGLQTSFNSLAESIFGVAEQSNLDPATVSSLNGDN